MLEQFDNDFTPVAPGRTANVEVLPNGDYILEIAEAELTTTRYTGETLVRWVYKVLSGPAHTGLSVENGNLLRSQDAVNRLGADLMVLGVNCNEWSAAGGKPFSKMLPQALLSLKGVKVNANKSTTEGRNGKTYHNLNIRSRTNLSEMPVEMPF